LSAYLLVEQESAEVTLFRRTERGFVTETYRDDTSIPLPEIGAELLLSEIYDGVEFTPEPDDAEF
jgi:hypothetical protein